MTTIAYSPVNIQTSAQSVPSIPAWFGEITLMTHHLQRKAGACCDGRAGPLCSSPLRTLRGDRFSHRAVRLCRQLRTDARKLLRATPTVGKRVHGTLWARPPACAFNPQPLSRRAGSAGG